MVIVNSYVKLPEGNNIGGNIEYIVEYSMNHILLIIFSIFY